MAPWIALFQDLFDIAKLLYYGGVIKYLLHLKFTVQSCTVFDPCECRVLYFYNIVVYTFLFLAGEGATASDCTSSSNSSYIRIFPQ